MTSSNDDGTLAFMKTSYSCHEVCAMLEVTDGWLYKIESLLGLRGSRNQEWGASRQRGKKSSYGPTEVEIFKRIWFLRLAQITLSQIQKIYRLEKKIFDIVTQEFAPFDEFYDGDLGPSGINEDEKIAYVEFYLMRNIWGNAEGLEFSKTKADVNSKKSQELKTLIAEHIILADELRGKVIHFKDYVGQYSRILGR